MKNLRGKNCLLTGAASGIGRALAILLAKEGMNLYIVDIDTEKLENVRSEIQKGRHREKIILGYGNLSTLEIQKGIKQLKTAISSIG